ncbi:transposase [Streptomyces coelicoflavus]|uniref:transposase n=1 Tax=Streptomyces coelicoflavus TaxID=285562 RepID=UPI00364550AE
MVEPLLPKVERRTRHPVPKRHPDRLVFRGILFVPHTGVAWEHRARELGFGSGMTCRHRLAEWTEAGARPRLHHVLRAKLHGANAPGPRRRPRQVPPPRPRPDLVRSSGQA